MKKKLLSLMFVTMICLFVGCSKDQSTMADENKEEESFVEDVEVDSEETVEDEEVDYHITLDGKVFMEEDKIRVEGETNLIPGTKIGVQMYSKPFTMPQVFQNWEGAEVQSDGTFQTELELPDNFYKDYSGSYIELELSVSTTSMFGNSLEFEDVYGKYGEKFEGPFVYEYEVFDEVYKEVYVPVYILVGDDVKEYVIETPEREPLPDDYGDTEIWIETELTNDHRFFYIHGKSNLLQGTEIKGAYFAHPDDILPQAQGLDNRTYVQPDGTFLLRVAYDSLTDEGFIHVFSRPDKESHDPKTKILETYGENFEKLSGEYVVDDEEGGKMIEFFFEPEDLGVEPPENTSLTEEDGELKVQVPDHILFDFDKSDLKPEAQNVLDEVIDLLEELDDGTSIEINGHTDNQGDEQYNLQLSEERAAAVEKYLIDHGNLSHLNISKKGYGMSKPIASNEEEEGRERNRRVEIVINR